MTLAPERAAASPAASLRVPARRRAIVHLPSPIDENPYTRLLYGGLARFGFDLVPAARLTPSWLWRHRRHVRFLNFHWEPRGFYEWSRGPRFLRAPLSRLSLLWFAARLGVARALGYRVVWTVHEVRSHEAVSDRLERAGGRALIRASSLLLAHDDETAERVRREVQSRASVHVVPHGSYVGFYPAGRSRAEVRAELEIPDAAFVLLCFGSLKPYKRLDLVLEAFRSLPRADVVLIVAGNCRDRERHVGEAVEVEAGRDPRIRALIGLVPDARVAELYDAADAAVVARSDGWTSGSLILALSQGCPVVAPRLAPYERLTGGERAAWLFEPGDAGSLRDAVERASTDSTAREKRVAARSRADSLSWEASAARTAELLAAIAG